MRLPDDTLVLLKAIGRAVDAPARRVMVDALRAYYMGEAPALSAEQRRVVRALRKAHET